MSVYRVQARRHTHPGLSSSLSQEALSWVLSDATLLEHALEEQGTVALVLDFECETHQAGMNEVIVALQKLGYSVLNATVSDWVDRSVEGAVVGVASAAVGARAAKSNLLVGVIAMIGGGVVAHWIGAQMQRLEVVYELARSGNRWTWVQVNASGSGPVTQPATSRLQAVA